MKKKTDFQSSLSNLGSSIKNKKDSTPIQEVAKIKVAVSKVQETRFTVHIPTILMDRIKDIGHIEKKKLKTIFVEALQDYADKNDSVKM